MAPAHIYIRNEQRTWKFELLADPLKAAGTLFTSYPHRESIWAYKRCLSVQSSQSLRACLLIWALDTLDSGVLRRCCCHFLKNWQFGHRHGGISLDFSSIFCLLVMTRWVGGLHMNYNCDYSNINDNAGGLSVCLSCRQILNYDYDCDLSMYVNNKIISAALLLN